jgi:hypothetical protein
MPNGADKNLIRLSIACAVYRQRFREWPSEARLAPVVLWDIAQLLDGENFISLAARLRLRTSEHAQISVGGSHGHVNYEEIEHSEAAPYRDQAWRWLGIEVRRDIEGH